VQWVIAYDIDDDAVRDRVARVLLRHGKRVQESVFECGVDGEEIRLLAAALSAILGAHGGIRFYRLCRACQPEAFGVGEVRPAAAGGDWIIT
jgi:CRISPR-associated protein Cas2